MFTDRPPSREKPKPLTLVRTPPAGKLIGHITCDTPVAAKTHYYGGRTMPCTGDLCRACEDKRGHRWHVYVTLFTAHDQRHVLHECTDDAGAPIYAWADAGNKLRGTRWVSYRTNSKANGPVQINLFAEATNSLFLPVAIDIKQVLCQIWKVAGSREEAKESGMVSHISNVLDSVLNQAHRGNGHGQTTPQSPPEMGGPQRPR